MLGAAPANGNDHFGTQRIFESEDFAPSCYFVFNPCQNDATVTEHNSKIRVVVADDDPIACDLIRNLVARAPGFEIVGEAADGLQVPALVKDLRPDILLLDLLMPRMQGMAVLHTLAGGAETVAVIVLAAFIDRQQLLQSLQLGARGVLSKKSVTALAHCLFWVVKGAYWVEGEVFQSKRDAILHVLQLPPETAAPDNPWKLTPRELQVASLVAVGQTNAEIAATLSVNEDTIKRHLSSIFGKCGVTNRVQLALLATQQGLAHHAARGAAK
jgi:two-component system nitrate/nitrite response regulator NarL